MKYLNVMGILMISLLFAACATTNVTVIPSNKNVKLSDYKSFSFFETEASGDTTTAFEHAMTLLKTEVAEQMKARGVTEDTDNPELKINLGITVEEKTQTRQTSLSDPGEWNYIGQRNYKWESRTVEVGTYKEGSITLHLVDRSTNEAVWVGLIEGILPRNPNKREKAIEEAVAALFAEIDGSGS